MNVALGEVLGEMRRSSWKVSADYAGAEDAADARLGKHPVNGEHAIETAIALVYPPEFQQLDGEALREAIRETNALEYALYTHVQDDERGRERLPEAGWLRGGVIDLAMLVHRAATPAPRVEALADAFQEGVGQAAKLFDFPYGSERGIALAGVLNPGVEEEDTEERRKALAKADTEQSRRMAMTVILNALVFHESLAEAEFRVPDADGHIVPSVETFWEKSTFQRRNLLAEWDAILDRNYWPIFASAKAMLGPDVMPATTAARIAHRLWGTANELVQGGVTRSHDLTGTVFQRLIADRKFLATFYTRPEAAALLAGLALPADRPPGGMDWSNRGALADTQIGDFACGTGTLLSAAYQRLSLLHELHGGDAKALHGPMMAHGLYGLDVLNIAVHLTAAMLAGAQPDTPFDGECLLTMPYGARDDGNAAIGSLDLLAAEVQPALIGQAAAPTAGGRSPEDVRDLVNRVGHGKFDLVIMNPPFTRQGGQEADRKGIGNAAFAAFNTPRAVQDGMQAKLRTVSGSERLGSGNAGVAAHFADLGMRKLRPGGTLALVLPLSAMSGSEWEATRRAIGDRFGQITVLTISAPGSDQLSFSADTGMAECLIAASGARSDGRRSLCSDSSHPRRSGPKSWGGSSTNCSGTEASGDSKMALPGQHPLTSAMSTWRMLSIARCPTGVRGRWLVSVMANWRRSPTNSNAGPCRFSEALRLSTCISRSRASETSPTGASTPWTSPVRMPMERRAGRSIGASLPAAHRPTPCSGPTMRRRSAGSSLHPTPKASLSPVTLVLINRASTRRPSGCGHLPRALTTLVNSDSTPSRSSWP